MKNKEGYKRPKTIKENSREAKKNEEQGRIKKNKEFINFKSFTTTIKGVNSCETFSVSVCISDFSTQGRHL